MAKRTNGIRNQQVAPLPSVDGVTTPITPLAQQSLTPPSSNLLGKISLPISLNKFYEPYLDDIRNCFLFLERFADEDEVITKLLTLYKSDPNKYNTDLDLDKIAEDAGITKGEFRRLFNATIDYLSDEEANMSLRANKNRLVQKSIEISLNDKHPDSYLERKSLMEYFGFRVVSKGAQTIINVDKSTNSQVANTQTNIAIANGLPSFAGMMKANEQVASTVLAESIESKQLPEAGEVIDITAYKPKATVEAELDEEDEDDEDE